MRLITATGDTWGISGPDFIKIYGGAFVVFVVMAIVLRVRASGAAGTDASNLPDPGQLAMLTDGRSRAVYACLAGLRAAGAVGVGQLRQLQVTGPAPAGLSRLDHAVYEAAAKRVQVSGVSADAGVRSALDDLQDGLVRAGWVLDPTQRASARLGGWLVLALAGFGLSRLIAGIANGNPVGFLVLLILLTAAVGVVLLVVPRRSAAGKRAIARARTAHAYLDPSQSPSWTTYGMAGAATSVALFGTSALWAADPAFAEEAGIEEEARRSSYSDSGGGDGGDGGGGCGGGGGGCGG
jgi:uncharacterized protein (TIGR04222 family)